MSTFFILINHTREQWICGVDFPKGDYLKCGWFEDGNEASEAIWKLWNEENDVVEYGIDCDPYLTWPEHYIEITNKVCDIMNGKEIEVEDNVKTCGIKECNNSVEKGNFCNEEHRCFGKTKGGQRCARHGNMDGFCEAHALSDDEKYATETEKAVDNEVHDDDELFFLVGTGSRELKNADGTIKKAVWEWVLAQMSAAKEKFGDKLIAVSGAAEGFDEVIALAAIHLGVRLMLVIPNKDYPDYYWGRNSLTGFDRMEQFNEILEKAWKVIYVKEDVYGLAKERGVYLVKQRLEDGSIEFHATWDRKGEHFNMVRNEVMVEFGHAFLVYDSKSAGTMNCVNKIKKAGKGRLIREFGV